MSRPLERPPEAGRLAFCAAAAAAGMTLSLTLPRLPAAALAESPGVRSAAAWAAVLLVLGGLLAAAWLLGRGLAGKRVAGGAGKEALLRGFLVLAGAVAALRLAHASLVLALDVVLNAWFFPESLDPLEPAALLLAAFLAAWWLLCLLESLLAWAWRGPSGAGHGRTAGALLLGGLLLHGGARFGAERAYQVGAETLSEAAGLPPEPPRRRGVLVLTESGGRPDYESHELELGVPGSSECSEESLRALEAYAEGPRTVYTLPALRRLYGAMTLTMDAEGLRRVLLLGHRRGDGLARVLLLENLAAAAPPAAAREALKALAGSPRPPRGRLAAAQFALAFARQGDRDEALAWLERASAGLGGPAPGLLALPEGGGALSPGSVRGRVAGAAGAAVALYAHPDAGPRASYALSPGRLAASARVGPGGAFAFSGLPAGRYFLALSFDLPEKAGRARLRGHSGDVELSRARPRADLGTLAVSFARR